MASRIIVKDQENLMHDLIYKTISTLTLIYPTTAEFKDKFKMGMFRKNNQPGCQQIVYYLFSIIGPDDIHKRITSWPITDVRMESKYRMEVMRFYGHLQENHPDFGLKNLLSSHLITPGGYKFAKFILKLADLASFVHLSKDGHLGDILLRPRPSKDDADLSEDMVLVFKNATATIKEDTMKLLEEHEKLNKEYNSELETIDQNLLEVKTQLYELNNKCKTTKNSLEEDFKKSGMEHYEDWQKTEIQSRLTKLSGISEKFKECTEIIKYLLSKENVLLYDRSNSITSDLFSNTIDSNDNLNLISFFETFLKYLQGKLTNLDILSADHIKPGTEFLEKINVEQECIHNDMQVLQDSITKAQNELICYKINASVADF